MQRNNKSKKKQHSNDQWDNDLPVKKKKVKQRLQSKVKYKQKWLEIEEEN